MSGPFRTNGGADDGADARTLSGRCNHEAALGRALVLRRRQMGKRPVLRRGGYAVYVGVSCPCEVRHAKGCPMARVRFPLAPAHVERAPRAAIRIVTTLGLPT